MLRRESAFILRPTRAGQVRAGDRGVALVGEAAGWISPSSAEGLSYAFHSALLLAEVLQRSLHGFERRYREKTAGMRRNILLKHLKSRVIFSPGLRRIVMRSGLHSVKVPAP